MDNKEKGRIGLTTAISYFGLNGYTISVPLNDTQWYDLVVEKDGILKTVQCKCTTTSDNSISLRNTGGTNGREYDNVLNHPLDYLFCTDTVNSWLIPVEDIKKFKNKSSIYLRTEPNKNGQGFNTYKYLINSKNTP